MKRSSITPDPAEATKRDEVLAAYVASQAFRDVFDRVERDAIARGIPLPFDGTIVKSAGGRIRFESDNIPLQDAVRRFFPGVDTIHVRPRSPKR